METKTPVDIRGTRLAHHGAMCAQRPIRSSNLALELAIRSLMTTPRPRPPAVRSPAASVLPVALLEERGSQRAEIRSPIDLEGHAISAPAAAASAASMECSKTSRSNNAQSARRCYLASTRGTFITATPRSMHLRKLFHTTRPFSLLLRRRRPAYIRFNSMVRDWQDLPDQCGFLE